MSSANSPGPSVDHLADPVFAVDPDGVLRYANDTAADVLGWDATELLGTAVLDLVHPDDVSLATSALHTVQDKVFGELLTLRVRTGRGTWRYLEFRGSYRQPDPPDPLAGLIVIVARDVTDRHRLEFDQGDTEVLRAVMANMHGMVILADANGLVRSVNGAVTRLLGHDPEIVRGRSILDYLHEDDRDSIVDAAQRLGPQGSLTLDARVLTADGTPLICEFTINNLLDDPVVASYVISAQIATSLADARDRVEFLAEHDSRTGLLNRDGFMRAARTMMQSGTGLGILIVDLVHFRSINELYGEPVGDAVLSAVAERIDQIRWPDLITARFGGDEFVLAIRASSPSAVEMLRERVRRDVAKPIDVDGQEVNFDIRTAMAFEARPQVLDALLVSASNDLMSAKRFADPTPAASPSMRSTNAAGNSSCSERRSTTVRSSRSSSRSATSTARSSPSRHSCGGYTRCAACWGWATSCRWPEMAGLAEAVDDQVIDRALQFAVRLVEAGHPGIEVHVNIDPKAISRAAFGASFLERCRRAGANPAQLVVEITETDLLSPGAASLANMQKLRFAGIHVAIDDFGTGYSSLAHLLELPIDGVKIDRRFVAGIDVDPAATNLTTAILGLSDNLRLTCVAEGVEQPYQRDRLAELGCRAFQGWLFSPAVAADDLLAMLPRIEPNDDSVADAALRRPNVRRCSPPTTAPDRPVAPPVRPHCGRGRPTWRASSRRVAARARRRRVCRRCCGPSGDRTTMP
jgi:diguanylate cyclase (GGDEF)-like protein/PAS domain S-box-containing protein